MMHQQTLSSCDIVAVDAYRHKPHLKKQLRRNVRLCTIVERYMLSSRTSEDKERILRGIAYNYII